MKILANDGISESGKNALEAAGFEVILNKVAQEQLINFINENEVSAILVRSATQVRKDIIDACPSIKLIGRGGVGMDNIDVEYAKSKGIEVINTPAASSESVAELVFAHLFGMVRFLSNSNRNMPLEGDSKFKDLKKAYAKGKELRGKTLGIIGAGRIGRATAKIGLGVGMKVVFNDPFAEDINLDLDFFDGQKVSFKVPNVSKDELLAQSDFISLHIPASKDGKAVLGAAEFAKMKDGAGIVNAARGGVINEVELIEALDSNKIAYAGLDVFENEPTPSVQILMNPKVSLTPHIGAATNEAQDRIGIELAEKIAAVLK